MSAICCNCMEKVCKPDILWYAGTRYSPTVNWICGTCLCSIPESERVPVSGIQDFDISFGRVNADTNDNGVYQNTGSKQGPSEFTVEAETLRQRLSRGEYFLYQLYPFYCVREYLEKAVRKLNGQKLDKGQMREYLINAIQNTGSSTEHIINWKLYDKNGVKETASSSSFKIPIEIPRENAEELLDRLEQKTSA